MSDAAALSIEGLAKQYGQVHAVQGVDLVVQRGEVFGFLGPNGSGKTTTIRCILDLIRPTAGRIRVLGLDPRRDGVTARRRVAYVPGELRMPERTTGGAFVEMILRLRGRVAGPPVEALRERLDVDLQRPMRDLSTGNRRKVALLLAFSAEADLLILDEPTSGLDPLMQAEFLKLVREAAGRGAAVFLSSHSLGEVQRAADRVAVLRAGRIIATGTVDELRGRTRQTVEAWFVGPVPGPELAQLPGLEGLTIEGQRVAATLSGSVQPLVELLAAHPVSGLRIEEPDLETAFLDLYAGGPGADSPVGT